MSHLNNDIYNKIKQCSFYKNLYNPNSIIKPLEFMTFPPNEDLDRMCRRIEEHLKNYVPVYKQEMPFLIGDAYDRPSYSRR